MDGENTYHSHDLHEPLSRIFGSFSKAHDAALHIPRAGFPGTSRKLKFKN